MSNLPVPQMTTGPNQPVHAVPDKLSFAASVITVLWTVPIWSLISHIFNYILRRTQFLEGVLAYEDALETGIRRLNSVSQNPAVTNLHWLAGIQLANLGSLRVALSPGGELAGRWNIVRRHKALFWHFLYLHQIEDSIVLLAASARHILGPQLSVGEQVDQMDRSLGGLRDQVTAIDRLVTLIHRAVTALDEKVVALDEKVALEETVATLDEKVASLADQQQRFGNQLTAHIEQVEQFQTAVLNRFATVQASVDAVRVSGPQDQGNRREEEQLDGDTTSSSESAQEAR